MEGLALLAVVIVLTMLVGSIAGIVAAARLNSIAYRLRHVESELAYLRRGIAARTAAEQTEPEAGTPSEEEPAAPEGAPEPEPSRPEPKLSRPSPPRTPPAAERPAPRKPQPKQELPIERAFRRIREGRGFEFELGTRWLGYVGVILFLVGAGLFLKYAYDNNWIGPQGRIAIGCLAGLIALALGEHQRRKGGEILFQTLTGGGIAIFYLCTYFAFQVYGLIGSGAAFLLAVMVTALGIVMSVAHNALPIAGLAVLGGFLSPVVLSGGGNHPYVLFSYIAILDLTALGAALYRRWIVLDMLCFAGTVVLYQAWFAEWHDPAAPAPSLLFGAVFYLIFLLTPMAYSLYRRASQRLDNLVLLVVNSVYAAAVFWQILFEDHRIALGYALLAEGIITFLLFNAWTRRVASDRTAQSLLTLALGLVTLVIPVMFRGDVVPVAWALEGALLVYLGVRFANRLTRWFGVLALLLGVVSYVTTLEPISEPVTAVFNAAFATGLWVVAALALGAYLLVQKAPHDADELPGDLTGLASPRLGVLLAVVAYALTCFILHVEILRVWQGSGYATPRFNSLILLWTLIGAATLTVIKRTGLPAIAHGLTIAAHTAGLLVFLGGLGAMESAIAVPFVAPVFLIRAAFIASLIYAARILRRDDHPAVGMTFEAVSQIALGVLFIFEFNRWTESTGAVTHDFGTAMVSAAWAVQAAVVTWWGLATNVFGRRVMGFLLFGLAILKVVFIDAAALGRELQILVFIASGVVLIVAAWVYQRFSALFLPENHEEPDHD